VLKLPPHFAFVFLGAQLLPYHLREG